MPSRAPLVLQENCPIALKAAGGRELRTLSGIVWLTASGETDDVFLRAGESCRLPRRAHVVIEAVDGEAQVELRRPWWRGWSRMIMRGRRLRAAIGMLGRLAVSRAPTFRV